MHPTLSERDRARDLVDLAPDLDGRLGVRLVDVPDVLTPGEAYALARVLFDAVDALAGSPRAHAALAARGRVTPGRTRTRAIRPT